MALDLDKTKFTSTLPAFRNKDSGSFTISISGSVAAGATQTWSNSTTFSAPARFVRYSMQQDVVPGVAPYTSSQRVPLSIMVGGSNFSPYLTTSAGYTAPNIYITSTTTGATVTVSVFNGSGGSWTQTPTVLTIYYTAFELFGE